VAETEQRAASIRIDYRDGRQVTVPRGFSILEASRWARIPHASVCGGRGRCSTCRVRVMKGLDQLPPPQIAEMVTLKRIGAPVGVRLACQVRPTSALAVTPLVPVGRPLDGLRVKLDEGRELSLTALFIDLRDSTRLAAGRLPFDAIFIVDRYIQAVTAAISACHGHITSVAGDGIMSVFGVDGAGARGACDALAAACAAWRSIDQVSGDLAADLGAPLRFGIGVHSGIAVIGAVGLPDQTSVHFLGDVGNIASRLESLTKEMDCTLIVSAATLAMSDLDQPLWHRTEVAIRGRDEGTLEVFPIRRREDVALPGGAV
jgi:adenylate cyclase